MPPNPVCTLYRVLLRRAIAMEKHRETFFLRQPVFGEFEPPTPLLADDQVQERLFDTAMAAWGLQNVLYLPAMPVTGASLQSLIRTAFRHPRTIEPTVAVQQCVQALRFINQQRQMETLSYRTLTDGIMVDITTRYARVQPERQGTQHHDFEYSVRVVNMRPDTVKLEGRHWKIYNNEDILVQVVDKWQRGVVGQQPVIPPGFGFQVDIARGCYVCKRHV